MKAAMKKPLALLTFAIGIIAVLLYFVLKMMPEMGGKDGNLLSQYKKAVENSSYMMHAGGGMEGTYSYTNSIDALEANYADGYRLFEVDISFTSDYKLVLAHSHNNAYAGAADTLEDNVWTEADWTKKLGLPYNPDHPLASYEEFMSFTIQGKFRATSFADLIAFVQEHDDVYIMLDIGSRSRQATKKIYQAIVDETAQNDAVLQHFIVGGHTAAMIEAVKEVYDFQIINLYLADEEFRQENDPAWLDIESFADYCNEQGITSFSISADRFTADIAEITSRKGLISYVFTCNDEGEAAQLRESGATIIGTDFLR